MTRTLAGYEILEDLGRNAWGKAFRARQISLDRVVSLTVLPAEPSSKSAEMLERACAAVTHPHLVSGIDLGTAKGVRFLVTEWVEGPTVGDLTRRGGALAEERVLEIGLAAAHAIDCANRKGLVHGNLSPEAIVVTNGGNPKVRGFGADRDSVRCADDYRSPEQKQGVATDVRSDVYSLGLVLHYLLTGVYPFEDAPPAEVVGSEVIEVPASLASRNRRLAPTTVEVVERMCAFRSADRFQDAGSLGEALELAQRKLNERVTFRPARDARPIGRPAGRIPRGVRRRRRRLR